MSLGSSHGLLLLFWPLVDLTRLERSPPQAPQHTQPYPSKLEITALLDVKAHQGPSTDDTSTDPESSDDDDEEEDDSEINNNFAPPANSSIGARPRAPKAPASAARKRKTFIPRKTPSRWCASGGYCHVTWTVFLVLIMIDVFYLISFDLLINLHYDSDLVILYTLHIHPMWSLSVMVHRLATSM